MRSAFVLALVALVALVSRRSGADAGADRARKQTDARRQAAAIVAAFDRADDPHWPALLEPIVNVQGAHFADHACDKAFGGDDVTVRVTPARRGAFVRCLANASWRPLAADDMNVIEPFDNMFEAIFSSSGGAARVSIQLRPRVEPKRPGEAGELRIFRIQVE